MICRVNCTNQTRHIVEIDSENRIFLLEISVEDQASLAVFLVQGRPSTMSVLDQKVSIFVSGVGKSLEVLIYQADCPGQKKGLV